MLEDSPVPAMLAATGTAHQQHGVIRAQLPGEGGGAGLQPWGADTPCLSAAQGAPVRTGPSGTHMGKSIFFSQLLKRSPMDTNEI